MRHMGKLTHLIPVAVLYIHLIIFKTYYLCYSVYWSHNCVIQLPCSFLFLNNLKLQLLPYIP